MYNRFLIISLICFFLSSCVEEVSQWRGPNRDGIYPDKGLLKAWPDGGPELLLTINEIGPGVSQPVVYKDVIYVTGNKVDSMDVISAYDMKGELLWDKIYSKAWHRTYPFSLSTPTIENNRIYLIGGMGDLVCLSSKNGDIIWKNNPHERFQGKLMHWGISESVLLGKKSVFYVTGGKETTLVAFGKDTGELLWKTKSQDASRPYASSLLVEWNGMEIVLVQTNKDLMSIDASNGEILWNYNTLQYHSGRGKGEATNTPLYLDGEIFVTYGNEQPGMMFSLAEDGRSVSLKWSNDILDTHHGGLVQLDGNIYGSNMQSNKKGNWVSVEWESGKTNWEEEWFTKGCIISADEMLYLYEEQTGHVALVQPDRDRLKVISSFHLEDGTGPHWAHPSVYDGKLYIRHGSVLLVYNIKSQ